jgi:hypothetical protein
MHEHVHAHSITVSQSPSYCRKRVVVEQGSLQTDVLDRVLGRRVQRGRRKHICSAVVREA